MCSSNHGYKSHNDGDLSTLKIYDEEEGVCKIVIPPGWGDNSPKVDSPNDSLQGSYTLLTSRGYPATPLFLIHIEESKVGNFKNSTIQKQHTNPMTFVLVPDVKMQM